MTKKEELVGKGADLDPTPSQQELEGLRRAAEHGKPIPGRWARLVKGVQERRADLPRVLPEVPTRAEGEAVTPTEGLPTVTLAESGQPSLDIPEGYTAPAELVAQTLIKGTGPVVESGQTIQVHYSGWKISDGTQFESSWESTPYTTAISTVTLLSPRTSLSSLWARAWADTTIKTPRNSARSRVTIFLPANE